MVKLIFVITLRLTVTPYNLLVKFPRLFAACPTSTQLGLFGSCAAYSQKPTACSSLLHAHFVPWQRSRDAHANIHSLTRAAESRLTAMLNPAASIHLAETKIDQHLQNDFAFADLK